MVSFLLFLSLIGNVVLLYYAFVVRSKHLSAEQQAQIEKIILRQAMHAQGRITSAEIAARSTYSLEMIENVFSAMITQNQCLSDLDADGRAIYVFPQFDDTSRRQEVIEREILLMAQLQGGEVSAEQVAMRTTMNIEESRQWLMVMAERNICAPSLEQPGRFRFQGLQR